MMLIICTLIFVAVFGVMFYSIWKHRKSKGAVAANFHENTTVEIVWTVIPFIIIIIMALPATRTVVAMKDTTNADLTIKVTGYQWKWGYDYIRGEGEGIGFLSELATPRGADRRHRGQGPDLPARRHRAAGRAGRQEGPHHHDRQRRHPRVVDPGVRREAGRDPRLRARHLVPRREDRHVLRAVRRAVRQGPRVHADRRQGGHRARSTRRGSTAARSRWPRWPTIPNKQWTAAELIARGEKVYAANCQACHQANGQGVAGAFPALAGSKVVANTPDQIAILLNGKNAMPSWKALSDVELAAVATYTKNAFGNKSGEVQPAEFKAARK